jgi:hypothetical protein
VFVLSAAGLRLRLRLRLMLRLASDKCTRKKAKLTQTPGT